MSNRQTTKAESLLALVLALTLPLSFLHMTLMHYMTIGILLACGVLPVIVSGISDAERAAKVVSWAIVLAAISGVVLAFDTMQAEGGVRTLDLMPAADRVALLGVSFILFSAFLWINSKISRDIAALAYGVGLLAAAATDPNLPTVANEAWKYYLAWPVTVIALSATRYFRSHFVVQAIVVFLLVSVSFFSEYRSHSAALIVALMISRMNFPFRRVPGFSALILLGVAAASTAVYYALTQAILAGLLGPEMQASTESQMKSTGLVVIGGRPEWSAALALIASRPQGIGPGVSLTVNDKNTALNGLDKVHAASNSQYVNHYMFGDGIHLHSGFGDLWAAYGLAGLGLALTVIATLIVLLVRHVGNGLPSVLTMFLILSALWDMFFSPASSGVQLALFAIAYASRQRSSGEADRNMEVPH